MGVRTNFAKPRTFLGEAQNDLSNVSNTLQLTELAKRALKDSLELSLDPWGQDTIPKKPTGWLSDVSHDNAPIEYSVAIEQRTGAAQLRLLVESQAKENSITAFQQSALGLTIAVKEAYPESISLDRLMRISHLFFPENPQSNFAAWHSFCVTPDAKSEWKIYLNPRARGADLVHETVSEALCLLGMDDAYDKLMSIMTPGLDNLIYFALDLNSSPHARVKVYVRHHKATTESLSRKIESIAPGTLSEAELQDFCAMMSGSEGPYHGFPLQSCFGFTRDPVTNSLKTEATVYFPVSHYAKNDEEVTQRIEKYLTGKSGETEAVASTYRKCVNAVAKRKLGSGRGIHSYVGLKGTLARGPVLNFYLSAEIYGALREE